MGSCEVDGGILEEKRLWAAYLCPFFPAAVFRGRGVNTVDDEE